MKNDLTTMDVASLVASMQYLVGAKVDKIYLPEKKEILLQVHVPSKGRRILRIVAGKFMYLTEHKPHIEQPSNFCIYLRRHFGNARIRAIVQEGFERVVRIDFERQEKKSWYIELFGKGNVIVVDEERHILSAIEFQRWKDRTVKAKEYYDPPKRKDNLFSLTAESFHELLQSSEKESLVKVIAGETGLGGLYAEEACMLTGIDKLTPPKEVTKEQNPEFVASVSSIYSTY